MVFQNPVDRFGFLKHWVDHFGCEKPCADRDLFSETQNRPLGFLKAWMDCFVFQKSMGHWLDRFGILKHWVDSFGFLKTWVDCFGFLKPWVDCFGFLKPWVDFFFFFFFSETLSGPLCFSKTLCRPFWFLSEPWVDHLVAWNLVWTASVLESMWGPLRFLNPFANRFGVVKP